MQAAAQSLYSTEDFMQFLAQSAQLHLRWLQTSGREGRRANFCGMDLSGISMKGMYLPDACFRSAKLEGTDLSEANLQGADFSEALMEHTYFNGASIDGANFARSQIRFAYMDAIRGQQVNFSDAKIHQVSVAGADLCASTFRNAVIEDCDFSHSRLQHAAFRYTRATDCTFDHADFSHSDARNAVFDGSRFGHAMMIHTNMRGATFEEAYLGDTNFNGAIDLEVRYQAESIALEKQSIEQEVENLHSVREEVSHYETLIHEQRLELAKKRKILDSLEEVEAMVSEGLAARARVFGSFALAVLAVLGAAGVFALIYPPQVTIIGWSTWHYGAAAAMALAWIVLPCVTAWLASRTHRQYAQYVALRHDRLAKSRVDEAEEETVSAFQSDAAMQHPNVTYL